MNGNQAAADAGGQGSAESFRHDAGSASTGRTTRLPSISALLNTTDDPYSLETASSSQQPVDLPPHHQRGSASASESALSSARSSFEQQHMPYPRANGTAAPLSGYGASPAIAHWVVSPSSPPSRRSSASFALPNGNALHPLPSGLSHHDGRPRSSSTPFVSYSYGQSSGRSSGFALSSERGCNNGDGAQGSQPNGRWSPPPSEDPTRPRSVSIPMNGETSPQSHSKSFGFFTMLPAMSEHEDGRGHALPFRHGTHPNYTGHASAVPRFAFLGPVDSPSTFSSANAEDEDLPPPVGYPFKDSYRPAHPSVDQTRRTTPSLNTQVPTSAQLSSRFPPAVASGLASAGPVSPVTSESSAPSPFSAPSPVATSPKTQQARVPAKRSRQSIVASEEADGAACSPTDNSGPSTESSQPETGRYTCPHCPKRFARPSSLRIHMHSHTGEKPFLCSLCERAFSVQSNLRRHLKIHKGGPNEDSAEPKSQQPKAPQLDIPSKDHPSSGPSSAKTSAGPMSARSGPDSSGPSSAMSTETATSFDSLPTPVDMPVRSGPMLGGLGKKSLITDERFDEREEDAIMASPDGVLNRGLA